MLVNPKRLLIDARKEGYAIGSFNATNLETVQGIISAAEELNSPAIVSTTESAMKHMGFKNSYNIISGIAKDVKVPIALHLDHGPNIDLLKKCVKIGYTSVMIDASHENFQKNIAITKKAVFFAKNIPVEAELGRLQGVEDHISVAEKDVVFTNPLQAEEFMKKTKAFSLAVAIGTSHGAYKFKGESKLDIQRLKEIAGIVKNPLVLHGASSVSEELVNFAQKYGAKLAGAKGVSDSEIREAVKNGISKINVDTDIRISFLCAIRKSFSENPENIDIRKYLGLARESVKKTVIEKINLFGSENKA